MERLTVKLHNESIWRMKECGRSGCENICKKMESCLGCPIQKATDKLAKYEDLEEIFRSKMSGETCDILNDKKDFAEWLDRIKWTAKKLDEYAAAEEQGKLLKLPVAVGDTVYAIHKNEYCGVFISEAEVLKVSNKGFWVDERRIGYKNIGKKIFITQEAAEAALKEIEKVK